MADQYTSLPWVRFSCDGVESLMPAMRSGEVCTGLTPADAERILLCVTICKGLSNDEIRDRLGWPK